MPVWTTHTEGGSWTGGGTEVPDCSLEQRNALLAAFDDFIDDSCLDCFEGLRVLLTAKWATIEIDCTDSDCDGSLWGRRSGNKILICPMSFTAVPNPGRLQAVLLHELVHAVGGTELDSEAVERACFNGNGATLPSSGDWDLFESETSAFNDVTAERKGKFVIWNSNTGEVWGIASSTACSGGDDTKGPLCFQDRGWINPVTNGGGGWI